jgi:hypothetical protein
MVHFEGGFVDTSIECRKVMTRTDAFDAPQLFEGLNSIDFGG